MGMLDAILGMFGGQQQPGADAFASRFAGAPAGMLDLSQMPMLPNGQVAPTPTTFAQIDRTTPRPQPPWTAPAAPDQTDAGPLGAGNMAAFGALSPSSTPAPALPPPINVPNLPATPARDEAALRANATPTVGDASNLSIAPTAAPSAQPASPGIGQTISDKLMNVAGILSPEMRQRQIQNQTTQALVKKGLDPDMAATIAANPTLMQQVVPQLFGPKAYQHVSIKDAFGNEIPLSYDPSTARYLDARGKPFGAAGDGTPGIPGAGDFLAKGVTNVNHDLQGEDYLKQFSPEVQAGVKNYLDGKTLTTGNARQGFTQTVKMIAQKYGADIGKPADDIAVNARRQMSNDLSKGTPGSLGGQITFGGTSLGHLADTAEKAVSMKNVSGFGIAPVAELANRFRGLSTDQASKVNETSGAIQHYGQEITKFYTGSPGGEAERMRFLNTMNTAKSPQEIAGAIRTERDLIPDRIQQIGAQIADRLGPEEAQKQMARANLQGVTDRINRALAKLDPNGPEAKMYAGQAPAAAAPQAAPAGRTSGGVSWSIVQ